MPQHPDMSYLLSAARGAPYSKYRIAEVLDDFADWMDEEPSETDLMKFLQEMPIEIKRAACRQVVIECAGVIDSYSELN